MLEIDTETLEIVDISSLILPVSVALKNTQTVSQTGVYQLQSRLSTYLSPGTSRLSEDGHYAST